MMKIHHLRNATFIIEYHDAFILVDPTLNPKGSLPPFAFFRYKSVKNPTIDMPAGSEEILNKVTHVLVTHRHPDHLDKQGIAFVTERQLPVVCGIADKAKLDKAQFDVALPLEFWQPQPFLDGKITAIPAHHGYGFIAKLMGAVAGFYIQFDQQNSIYISSDTVYTAEVERVFTELNPTLSVLAAGSAQFDFGGKLLMNEDDIVTFVQKSPNKVYANHMEAINHCPMTRTKLTQLLTQHQLQHKVIIPEDGESFDVHG